MNKPTQIIDNPGHYEDPEEGHMVESTDLAALNSSEIDMQIATAHRFPRSLLKVRQAMTELATLDESTASACIYAIPRDGKIVEGPSSRFAEILACCWGNNRSGGRVVSVDDEFVTGQGFFFDLEKNAAITYEVKRRITGRDGRRFSADMIMVTGNAAASIAHRNAVLKGVPKALWIHPYEKAKAVVAGTAETLHTRRTRLLKELAVCGATSAQVFGLLGVRGVDDIGLEHMVSLSGIYTSIKEGSIAVEEAFAPEKMKGADGETLTPPRPVRGSSEFERKETPATGAAQTAQGGQKAGASEDAGKNANASQRQEPAQQVAETTRATTQTDATVTKGPELALDPQPAQTKNERADDSYRDWFNDNKERVRKAASRQAVVSIREEVKKDIDEDSPYMAEWVNFCAARVAEIAGQKK